MDEADQDGTQIEASVACAAFLIIELDDPYDGLITVRRR